MASKLTVKDGAGELLGVLPLGGTLDSKASTRLDKAYDEVFADLKKSGLDSWPTGGAFDDSIAPHVEALMAFNAMDTFFVPDARAQRIILRESKALREIRRLSIPDYESLDEVVDY